VLRDLVAVLVGINALGAIFGFGLRRLRRQRRLAHADYVRQLRAENDELDRELERLHRGRPDSPAG
jgi:hypothetical protein